MTPSLDPVEALVAAVRRDDVDGAAALLEAHGELRAMLNDPLPQLPFGSTILQPAVERQSRAMVDLLVGAGADISAKSHWWAGGFGVLDIAVPDFVPFLLERGARMTFYAAARLGRKDDVERPLHAETSL